MNEIEKSVIFSSGVPFVVNGRAYEVAALPVKDIICQEFAKCGLHFPADGEPVNSWQAINLQNEQYRNTLDKWLKRLLTLDGVSQGLEDIAAAQWTDTNIGEFLSLVLESSGLARKEAIYSGEPAAPEIWLDVLTEFQYHLRATWEAVTSMPLLRLNALRERVVKHAINSNMSGLLSGMLGGGSGQPAHMQPQTKADPRMGETPQLKSRDEYFAFMNQHR